MARILWLKSSNIIGIERNPNAIKIRELGFEIYIANQESASDLREVFETIGPIDLLVDDGAHTARGQITSCLTAIDYIRNNGLIVIEDTHSSYASDFGMPHKYSFSNWVNQVTRLLDLSYLIERDLFKVKKLRKINSDLIDFSSKIQEVRKFRSMTVFHVQKSLPRPQLMENMKSGLNSEDFRWSGNGSIFNWLKRVETISSWNFQSAGATNQKYRFLSVYTSGKRSTALRRILKPLNLIVKEFQFLLLRLNNRSLVEFFKRS